MNRKTETAEFPYANRPMWLYSRSSDKRMFVLIQQMRNLLEEANHREYTVVGTSQDMGTSRSMARMGLPLRYNKDKRKNPVFSRVSAFVVAYSIPFPTLLVNEKSVE